MRTPAKGSQAGPPPSKPAADIARPQISSASVPDTLASLHVDPDTGLTHAEVDVRRKEHGYNDVAVENGHPFRKFLGKFCGISADSAGRAPLFATAQCQNGLPARKNPTMVATTDATAKASHIHVGQVGRNGGGRGMVLSRV